MVHMEIEDAIHPVIDRPFLRIIDVPTVDIAWATAGCPLERRLTLYKADTRRRAPRSGNAKYHLRLDIRFRRSCGVI